MIRSELLPLLKLATSHKPQAGTYDMHPTGRNTGLTMTCTNSHRMFSCDRHTCHCDHRTGQRCYPIQLHLQINGSCMDTTAANILLTDRSFSGATDRSCSGATECSETLRSLCSFAVFVCNHFHPLQQPRATSIMCQHVQQQYRWDAMRLRSGESRLRRNSRYAQRKTVVSTFNL